MEEPNHLTSVIGLVALNDLLSIRQRYTPDATRPPRSLVPSHNTVCVPAALFSSTRPRTRRPAEIVAVFLVVVVVLGDGFGGGILDEAAKPNNAPEYFPA